MGINGLDLLVNEETVSQSEVKIKRYAHVISPPENGQIYSFLVRCGNPDPSAQDIVACARERRWFVVALCGYRWIPERNPEDYDACQICMDVAGMHMRNEGE